MREVPGQSIVILNYSGESRETRRTKKSPDVAGGLLEEETPVSVLGVSSAISPEHRHEINSATTESNVRAGFI
jgi:hypothetical protein